MKIKNFLTYTTHLMRYILTGAILITLHACADDDKASNKKDSDLAPIQITITFNTIGGSEPPSPITVNSGEVIEQPTQPTHSCYTAFEGWTAQADYSGENFDFTTPIQERESFTLYAKWNLIPPEDENGKKNLCHWKQLEWIAAAGEDATTRTTRYGYDYILTENIVFPTPGTDSFPIYGFVPIGHDRGRTFNSFDGTAFTGTFDGNNKTIENFFIDTEARNSNANIYWPATVDKEFAGLFGQVGMPDSDATDQIDDADPGTVRNITLISPSINAAGINVGGIAGSVHIGSDVTHIIVTDGTITGRSCVGGLVGINHGTTDGYATTAVVGVADYGYAIGGSVGYNNGTVIGYANGAITGDNNVGGLVGFMNKGTAIGYATGTVSGDKIIGGLVGGNKTGTANGYATGAITGTTTIGGLVGSNDNQAASAIVGYWDAAASGQDASAGGDTAVRISATKNVTFTAGTPATYTDSLGTAESTDDLSIFNAVAFTTVFDTANGAHKTWPKLKNTFTVNGAEYTTTIPQPTVSDTDDDGVIEVAFAENTGK